MEQGRAARVLVVTDRTAATPAVLAAMRERVARGPAQFRLLVPNPARAEVHLLHPERHDKAAEAELVLWEALPAFEAAAGGAVIGSVSIRHDAYDAVEELTFCEPVDEIIVSVQSHEGGRWLHHDLPHRLTALGIPVLAISAEGSA